MTVSLTARPQTAWEKLIEIYADGRKICNCGKAYYSEDKNHNLFCAYGCSANCEFAKEDIAKRVLSDLGILFNQ